jgi:hypothetical protein
MTPQEFISLIASGDLASLKLAKEYMDKLPHADPAFLDEVCSRFKAMQPYDTDGKHLEIKEMLRGICAEREK